MDKNSIIKAMQCCAQGGGISACNGCPYAGKDACDAEMLQDALRLLQTPQTKYTYAMVYTKKANLTEYFARKLNASNPRGYYEKERDVQLIALFRWENGKCFCHIKCPINPVPTTAEFETTTSILGAFLAKEDWLFQRKFKLDMFI